MRYRYALSVLLLLLACLLLIGISGDPWPGKPWPDTSGTAAVEKFCDSTEADGAGLCHDFEAREYDVGISDCELSQAYGTINALGEIGYVAAGAPDCANTSSPLDGSHDLKISAGGGAANVSWYPLDGTGAGADVCANTETCIFTGLMQITSDTGAGAGNSVMATFFDSGFSKIAGMNYDGVNNLLRATCTAGDADFSTAIDHGSVYKICVKYATDDDLYVYLDAEDGTWCAGALESETVANCNGGVHQTVDYVQVDNGNDTVTVQFDNIIVVAE